jgi:hypothetical protein
VSSLTPERRRQRARAAALARHHPDKPELAADDRALLKEEALERHIKAMVDSWPPLSDSQRARLALLLRGGGDAA